MGSRRTGKAAKEVHVITLKDTKQTERVAVTALIELTDAGKVSTVVSYFML